MIHFSNAFYTICWVSLGNHEFLALALKHAFKGKPSKIFIGRQDISFEKCHFSTCFGRALEVDIGGSSLFDPPSPSSYLGS